MTLAPADFAHLEEVMGKPFSALVLESMAEADTFACVATAYLAARQELESLKAALDLGADLEPEEVAF